MANTIKIKRSAVPSKVPATTDLQLGELAINTYDGKLFLKKDDGTESIVQIGAGGSGSGDVVGPSSATDNALARYDGTTGKLIQNSVATIDDSGNLAGVPTITDINYVDFNTGYATTLGAGQLGWDGNNTLGLGMIGGNVIQHIGEDQFFYCKATSAITKGQVVMFTGAVGASGVPTGAPASGITDGSYIMGIAAESIATNHFGLVQSFGTLRNVNTSAYSDGDILWYDPAVTGGLTDTKPSAPNVKVQMAAVINGGSSGGGTILIRINPGSTLGGTDSNAQIGTPSNGQIITYDNADGYWKNTSLTAGTAISVSASASGVLTIANTAPDQTVVLTGAGTTTVTGTYPNFTITSNDQYDGTVTSVDMTVPTGLAISGNPITTSGTLALSYASGYSIPTNASQTNWDSAYTQRLQWDGGSTNLVAATGRTSLGATTLGANIFTITNPSAITFPRFNADNTVSALSAANMLTALGGTTVGINFFDLANPSAITFPRINADNSVSALSATDFRTAIGAGTGNGNGTVTSITAGTGLSGGTITNSGTIALANTAVTAGSYTSANITVDAQGRITAASNGASGIGVGQTWQSPTRAANTTYTNSTGKPIMVSIRLATTTSTTTGVLTVDGVAVSEGSIDDNYNPRDTVCAIIPNNSTYSFAGSIGYWRELR